MLANDWLTQLDRLLDEQIAAATTLLDTLDEEKLALTGSSVETLNESSASFGQPTQSLNAAFQPRMLQLGFRIAF